MRLGKFEDRIIELEKQVIVLEKKTGLRCEWSELAKNNYADAYGDMSVLLDAGDEILKWLKKANEGITMAECYPLPVPNTPVSAKEYIADLYLIEPSDIDLMMPL